MDKPFELVAVEMTAEEKINIYRKTIATPQNDYIIEIESPASIEEAYNQIIKYKRRTNFYD